MWTQQGENRLPLSFACGCHFRRWDGRGWAGEGHIRCGLPWEPSLDRWLAKRWPDFAIKGGKGLAENGRIWSFKSAGNLNKLRSTIEGLLMPMRCRLILETWRHFRASLRGFRASSEIGGGRLGRGFERPVGSLPELLSGWFWCHMDRLEEGLMMASFSRIAG